MEKLLDVHNLEISFRSRRAETKAVRDVSFSLYEGETLALVGESGCGKSVTAKALMGLLTKKEVRVAENSRILYQGENILDYSEEQWRRYCGQECAMIFQDSMAALNPTIWVGKQIAENLRIHQKITMKEAMKAAENALEEVGISNPKRRVRQYPHEFSGGMRQRSMIAMAMVCHPKILIADEPTTALDVTIQTQILELMKELKEKNRMSMLLITHDLGVVAGMADRIAVMYAGKIIELGTCREIYYQGKHPYTKALLNSALRLDLQKGEVAEEIKGMPSNLEEEWKGCAFAPRCRDCRSICREQEPPIYELSGGHQVSCWKMKEEESGC